MKRYDLDIAGLQYGDPYIEIEENDNGEYIKYSDFYDWIQKRSAMCEANSNAILADVRAELRLLISSASEAFRYNDSMNIVYKLKKIYSKLEKG